MTNHIDTCQKAITLKNAIYQFMQDYGSNNCKMGLGYFQLTDENLEEMALLIANHVVYGDRI